MVIENYHKKNQNLKTWIDCRKEFDNGSHSWILKPLGIYKVSPVIINFLENSIKLWNTNLSLKRTKGSMKSNKIDINCENLPKELPIPTNIFFVINTTH